jgi:RHS repeat-associated protein
VEIILNILSLYPSKMLVTCGYEYQKYSLVMEYDNMHNILGKTQVHKTSPDNTNWTKAHQTIYDLTYEKYNAAEFNVAGYSYTQPHAVRQIIDKPEATSTGNDVKTKMYDYDPNGNLTNITQKTGESDVVEKLRTNLWDEENRLRAVDITPDAEGIRPIAIYTYDAGGERILKHSNTSVSIYLNGKKVADTIQTNATLYPSGMLVGKLGNSGSEEEQTLAYTKHYYAGTQRVSSKIGTTENLGDYLYDWFTQGTGGPVDVIGSSFGVLENAEEGVIQVYDELGIDPPTYESDPVFIPVASFIHGGNEIEQYFFHPDHLGSTSYITNLLGEVSQHMEYFAFGEIFVEEHRSSNNSPYKFNSKELDEETGWYYYGARYYDPKISVWLSVDPLHEKYPGWSPYSYTLQNPINWTDPDGMQVQAHYNAKTGIVAIIDMDVYKSELPTVKVSAKDYKIGGIRNESGELTTNQILIIKGVFSGGHSLQDSEIVQGDRDGTLNRPKEVPIPNGKYNILDNLGGDKPKYLRLDAQDSYQFNDVHENAQNKEGANRKNFRFHLGVVSWGCVTACKNQNYDRELEWDVVLQIMNSTTSTDVPDRQGSEKFNPSSSRKKYGEMTIEGTSINPSLPKERERSQPVLNKR